jgi:hypothetical protein
VGSGRYGATALLPNSSCSGPCAPGYYCQVGSTSATSIECGSNALYCPEGASGPTSVPVGWYSTGGSATTRSGVAICDAGYYCVGNGLRVGCRAGRYGGDVGMSDVDCSGQCEAGYYCDGASDSPRQHVRGLAF